MESIAAGSPSVTAHQQRRADDRTRDRRHNIRKGFFVGTGLSGFVLGLLSLSIGLHLDLGRVPFRAWSLVLYLTGACIVVGAGQAAAGLYRRHRHRQG